MNNGGNLFGIAGTKNQEPGRAVKPQRSFRLPFRISKRLNLYVKGICNYPHVQGKQVSVIQQKSF